ncbi:hypothetical protein [Lichenifustis flavocetrariae]|uniref:Uncharacterized protein n=1 Tax=Lichenifustis flavocetrariae TaxID=2949735 RepID=A0AA42CHB1_9HYPH|nr:hypothetical protein [Lichenifustis flavocetrariae]MCW6507084.1 hypothetical protein [Lichenifustis flavocetrariae]
MTAPMPRPEDDPVAYAAILRDKAAFHERKGNHGTAHWFRREASKIEADPSHARITKGILGIMRQAGPMLKEGRI